MTPNCCFPIRFINQIDGFWLGGGSEHRNYHFLLKFIEGIDGFWLGGGLEVKSYHSFIGFITKIEGFLLVPPILDHICYENCRLPPCAALLPLEKLTDSGSEAAGRPQTAAFSFDSLTIFTDFGSEAAGSTETSTFY